MSNLSIGYHPHLLLNYEQKKKVVRKNVKERILINLCDIWLNNS
jgi:hypothetical protein